MLETESDAPLDGFAGMDLAALAHREGTPLYVYSADAIRSRLKALQVALKGLDAGICYAVKANSNGAVLKLLGDMGAGADIVSGGELQRALLAGIPAQRIVFSGVGKSVDEIGQALDAGGFPAQHEDNNLAVNLGAGLQFDFGRMDLRTEIGTRLDLDDVQATAGRQQNQFMDLLASVGMTVALGPEPMAAVAPAPIAPPGCADLDGDGDGVNDCNDKCPDSQAGQTIGPDGCPVPVSIDLKGVNFDFDKSTLRPDAVAILNEAIEILKRYPDLRVEVAGHTDSKGTDQYNQALSERRATAVYGYLTNNGIDSGRLMGPTGYGESRPIAPNTNADGSDNPEGRAQNRRTELNVQN